MSRGSAGAASADARRQQVRARYGGIAAEGDCCAAAGRPSSRCGNGGRQACCGSPSAVNPLGYSARDLAGLPDGANLGLGCGNPTALLALEPGQVVLDLGSGAGVDCFLASRRVGAKGHVIGVDMTPQMVSRARDNARKGRFSNVEFRLGEIEHLPVADASVDVVISNCVINLAPEKGPVYHEAFRVLRPGGRLAISDMVATRPISARTRADPSLWSSCSSGALEARELKRLLKRAGFREVHLDLKASGTVAASLRRQASLGVLSADIRAVKPKE